MAARGRPVCPRIVRTIPDVTYFKPRGTPLKDLEVVRLSFEELEAFYLVDYCDMEQEDAASRMGVSRRTLARDLSSGRRKVVDALVNGKAIEIKGGNYITLSSRSFSCGVCGHVWDAPFGSCRPKACPKCSAKNVLLKK